MVQADIDISNHDRLKDILNSDYFFDKVPSVVCSEDKLKSYCKTNLGLIEPQEIELKDFEEVPDESICLADIYEQMRDETSDNIDCVDFTCNTVELPVDLDSTAKAETFQYVPLLPLLKKILQNPDIKESICRKNELRQTQTEGNQMLFSYFDGQISRGHKLFSKNKTALQLHLYSNDFEKSNSIGAHRTLHKHFISLLEILKNAICQS